MMSDVIRQETVVFLLSVLHGVLLTLLYDLLRALRRAFPHGVAAVSAEDFLFWLTAGFLTFCLAFSETDGVLRGYVAVGIALGAVLYHETASPWIVKGLAGILKAVRRLFHGLFSLVGQVVGRIGSAVRKITRILSVPVKKICTKTKKRIEKEKKNDYNETRGTGQGSGKETGKVSKRGSKSISKKASRKKRK